MTRELIGPQGIVDLDAVELRRDDRVWLVDSRLKDGGKEFDYRVQLVDYAGDKVIDQIATNNAAQAMEIAKSLLVRLVHYPGQTPERAAELARMILDLEIDMKNGVPVYALNNLSRRG